MFSFIGRGICKSSLQALPQLLLLPFTHSKVQFTFSLDALFSKNPFCASSPARLSELWVSHTWPSNIFPLLSRHPTCARQNPLGEPNRFKSLITADFVVKCYQEAPAMKRDSATSDKVILNWNIRAFLNKALKDLPKVLVQHLAPRCKKLPYPCLYLYNL